MPIGGEARNEALLVQDRPAEQIDEDSDLAQIIAAWPNLPDHIKADVMALVKSVQADSGQGGPTV
jgi:hypothetical protein